MKCLEMLIAIFGVFSSMILASPSTDINTISKRSKVTYLNNLRTIHLFMFKCY